MASSAAQSASLRTSAAAATFSSTCATLLVPGIGSITGARRSTQAIATWLGVAPARPRPFPIPAIAV